MSKTQVGLLKNKKLIIIVGIIVLTIVVGALAFTSSDYWQSIKDSSASDSTCGRYTTTCSKDPRGLVTCKKVCTQPGVLPTTPPPIR